MQLRKHVLGHHADRTAPTHDRCPTGHTQIRDVSALISHSSLKGDKADNAGTKRVASYTNDRFDRWTDIGTDIYFLGGGESTLR